MGIRTKIANWILKDHQPGMRLIDTYGKTSSGAIVSEDSAMRLAAVNACVRVLSEDVASLPEHIYRRTAEGGKERAREHPLYQILHDQPNPEMTAFTFKQTMMVNVLLTGNAYAFLEFDRAGRVMAQWPLPSDTVEPFRKEGTGEMRYRIRGWRDVSAGEMLHVPGLSYDGLKGLSPIAYAREAIGLSKAAEEFGGRFFANGTHIGGIVEVGKELSDEAYTRLQDEFAAMYRGLQNAHGIPILEEGSKFHALGVSQQDAQFLDTRKYQRSEIASIFRVPPHMIGDLERATFSNIEHQSIEYLQRSLVPWLVRIEQEQRRKLLSREEQGKYVIEHDTSNFLRGDTQSRMRAYQAAVQGGIMTQNECRARENLNPKEGGDELLRPLNMTKAGEPEQDGKAQNRAWSFWAGSERRPARRSNLRFDRPRSRSDLNCRAIQPSAGRDEIADVTARMREGFAKWLTEQAQTIRTIIQETLSARMGVRALDRADEILEKLNAYYAEMAKNPLPEYLNDPVSGVCAIARKRLAEQFTAEELAKIDEAWIAGFLERYEKDERERLVTANRDEVRRLINPTDKSDVERLIKKLDGWGTERAKTMAETEIALAANEFIIAANRKNGYASVWISHGGCCEICRRMHGRTITNLKPPLHKGCGCTVTAKREGCFQERESLSGKTFGVDKHGKYAKIGRGDALETMRGFFEFDRWAGKAAEVIADGKEIDDVARLTEFYAGKPEEWKKMKRVAYGEIEEEGRCIEVHWYENNDVGCVDYKTKHANR